MGLNSNLWLTFLSQIQKNPCTRTFRSLLQQMKPSLVQHHSIAGCGLSGVKAEIQVVNRLHSTVRTSLLLLNLGQLGHRSEAISDLFVGGAPVFWASISGPPPTPAARLWIALARLLRGMAILLAVTAVSCYEGLTPDPPALP